VEIIGDWTNGVSQRGGKAIEEQMQQARKPLQEGTGEARKQGGKEVRKNQGRQGRKKETERERERVEVNQDGGQFDTNTDGQTCMYHE